jgi:hypothetical protein
VVRLEARDARKEDLVLANLCCFLIGAVAPLAGVGWLLLH